MRIWKLEIDLKLWAIYLMLGSFVQLVVAFYIWRSNIDLYTIDPLLKTSIAMIKLEQIKSNAWKVLAVAYALFLLIDGKRFFKKIKYYFKKLEDLENETKN